MHKISIPEPARQVALGSRGSLKKYERLEASRTALLVIDMQNGFLLPGMPIELPHGRDIIPNINRLAGRIRDAGGLVVWIQANFEKERKSWSNWLKMLQNRIGVGLRLMRHEFGDSMSAIIRRAQPLFS